MDEWTSECMNERSNERTDEWMNRGMDAWINEWMNERMNEWMNECILCKCKLNVSQRKLPTADTVFELGTLAVGGRARYVSATEASHNIEHLRMDKNENETFFWNPNTESGNEPGEWACWCVVSSIVVTAGFQQATTESVHQFIQGVFSNFSVHPTPCLSLNWVCVYLLQNWPYQL